MQELRFALSKDPSGCRCRRAARRGDPPRQAATRRGGASSPLSGLVAVGEKQAQRVLLDGPTGLLLALLTVARGPSGADEPVTSDGSDFPAGGLRERFVSKPGRGAAVQGAILRDQEGSSV